MPPEDHQTPRRPLSRIVTDASVILLMSMADISIADIGPFPDADPGIAPRGLDRANLLMTGRIR